MRSPVTQVLEHSSTFAGVRRQTLAALTRELTPVEFRRGYTIVTEGESGDRMYVIVEGKVKVGRRSTDGRQNLLAVLGPSEVFGELSVFDFGARTSTVTALTTVRAVSIDRAELSTLIACYPELGEQLLRVLARRLRDTHDNVSDLVFTDVPGRVAKLLLQLATRFGVQGPGTEPDRPVIRVPHDLTQEELAQLVGSSRETVNKALAEFVERGWIQVRGKTVLVLDRARLARRAR
ncbi:Crp/Fnr family transcriptional regulator [Mycolicibacterium mengxianglii]|uniref:Crp/Fnr family transcriptional regulator n=1 Tax=Mycolicibacterium mengxianglii TaxID=2736649 RepID=UPI0018EF0C1B|nr:Crp/Fnr family transcriptional regulator [Mycolicibacterium mengxianglii]